MSWTNSQAAQDAKARAAAAYARGVSAFESGDLATAEEIFSALVRQEPRLHQVWNALCLVALQAARPEAALERARQAVKLDRANVDYLNNLGIASGELGEFDSAEQAFRRAIKTKPTYVEARFNLAKLLHKQGQLSDSLKEYERAHAIEPTSIKVQHALTEAYQANGRPGRALEMLRAAGAIDNPGILTHGYATCLADVEGPAAALAWLRACLPREPGGRFTHGPLGVTALAMGEWHEGWKYYCLFYRERRAPGSVPTLTPLPARLDGKRILLRPDQGLGDTLFFLRFAAELQERGAAVSLSCERRLASLLQGARPFAIVDEDVDQGLWDWDLWITDLPAMLETQSVPAAVPIHIDESARMRARDLLARVGPGPYLGLTWRGGKDMARHPEFGAGRPILFKDVPLTLLGKALRDLPVTLVGIQRGASSEEFEALRTAAGAPVHDIPLPDQDLQGIAAVMEALDEYVAVSNTNVHFLAGLNRRARVLVSHPPYWRWMREGRSVWFPDFPLYRQPPSRDWGEPLARLREDLQNTFTAKS
jgi:Tfp pilus assembly protein PilF